MPISKNTKFDQESPVRNGNYHADFFFIYFACIGKSESVLFASFLTDG
jgi:hypothetical protein